VFGHFIGDVEVHVPRGFGFEEASTPSDSTVGFDHYGFRVVVYELKQVSELDSERS